MKRVSGFKKQTRFRKRVEDSLKKKNKTMNFLGHLYFSHDDLALMQANLFGDFVKGKDLSRYSLKIQ